MTKTYSLLIWHQPPEEISFYLVPDDNISRDVRLTLEEAHGHLENCAYLNDAQKEALARLNSIVCGTPEYIKTQFLGTPYAGWVM